jgi:mannose-1-phosphate guanylyltransferase
VSFQALVLAAGRGSRLGELGRRVPKALVEVGGRPLLAHQLEFLAAAGGDRAVVTAWHLADQIVDFVARGDHGLEVAVSVEPELLGTAGGARQALPLLRPDEPIVVLHADTLLDEPVAGVVAGHLASGFDGTICAEWLEDTRGKGVLDVGTADRIVAFREKPTLPLPGLANAGLYVLAPELIALAAPGRFLDFGHDLFPFALAEGFRLRAHRLGTGAHDVGTPESLAAARRRALEVVA